MRHMTGIIFICQKTAFYFWWCMTAGAAWCVKIRWVRLKHLNRHLTGKINKSGWSLKWTARNKAKKILRISAQNLTDMIIYILYAKHCLKRQSTAWRHVWMFLYPYTGQRASDWSWQRRCCLARRSLQQTGLPIRNLWTGNLPVWWITKKRQ